MIHVESGSIVRKISGQYEEVPYAMYWLTEAYLSQVMELQQMAFDHLNDPDVYQLQPERFIKNQFSQEGRTIGVIVEDRVVAFQVLHFPAAASDPYDRSENLGFDLGLPASELPKVAHLETNAVHPAYIGTAVGGKMSAYLSQAALEAGYYHLCATVAPQNCHIIAGLLNANVGVLVRGLKEKYGGKLRYILYRNLKNPILPEFHYTREILVTDIRTQQMALSEGFWGYRAAKTGHGIELIYGK